MLKLIIIILFVCLIHNSAQSSATSDSDGDPYLAAVVEYELTTSTWFNLRQFIRFIEVAAEQGVDIIVFPEMALTNSSTAVHVPFKKTSEEKPVPYENPELYDRILCKLSKAARNYEIYVVVNLQEVVHCRTDTEESCVSGQAYEYFSTNVVFDRSGALIDRYRKINILERDHNTAGTEASFFTTDFGVTFGNVIGSDLEFQNPGLLLVQKHNITNIVNPYKIASATPFSMAGSLQSAYANSLNINLLAAGANDVEDGNAGSGIYAGRSGALIGLMPATPMSRLLMAALTKEPGQVKPIANWNLEVSPSHDLLKIRQDRYLFSHNSRLLVPGYQRFKLFDKGTGCTFDAELKYDSNKPGHYYRAFAFDGVKPSGTKNLGLVSCGIVSCRSEDVSSCTYIQSKGEENARLELEIEMTSYKPMFDREKGTYDVQYYPESLTSDRYFLQPYEAEFKSKGDAYAEKLIYTLKKPTFNLVAFGIFGRVFGRDAQK